MRRNVDIAIIGAGIGGLAAAAALRRVGIEAQLYEQAEQFARVGAGIQQSPNAMKVHRGLGIEERLRDVAFAPATSLNREAVTGAVSNEHPLGPAAEARYGAPYLTLHRGDLHAALAESCRAAAFIAERRWCASPPMVRASRSPSRTAARSSRMPWSASTACTRWCASISGSPTARASRPSRLSRYLPGEASAQCRCRAVTHQMVGRRSPPGGLCRHGGPR